MKIIVVGGGFGGLKTAIELAKRKAGEIILISNQDYFLHHATLYSTAVGRDERESAIPIGEILKEYPAVNFVKDEISKVDKSFKEIYGKKATYKFDTLVLALGMVDQLSGVNGQKKYSYGVTSLQATKSFQSAFHDMILGSNGREIHCAIVGGGMVGVELAGALSEYILKIKDAHQIPELNTKLSLVELSDRLLPWVSKTASKKVTTRLQRNGINIITNQSVEKISRDNLVLRGKSLPVDMTIWTSGGSNNPFFRKHPDIFKLSKKGKVTVNQYMLAYPDIFVIGDNADTEYSGSASNAVKDAVFVAKNIKLISQGRPMKAKHRKRRPVLSIPINRFWAYVEWGGVYAAGVSGSLLRRLIELNYYCHFLPVAEAYVLWRKYRRSNELCTLCNKSEIL